MINGIDLTYRFYWCHPCSLCYYRFRLTANPRNSLELAGTLRSAAVGGVAGLVSRATPRLRERCGRALGVGGGRWGAGRQSEQVGCSPWRGLRRSVCLAGRGLRLHRPFICVVLVDAPCYCRLSVSARSTRVVKRCGWTRVRQAQLPHRHGLCLPSPHRPWFATRYCLSLLPLRIARPTPPAPLPRG